MAVWLLTGIWYGSGWNFLLWGMWFALFLILEKLFLKKLLGSLPGVLGWLYTAVVVLVGWVLFSMDSLPAMEGYLRAMVGLGSGGLWDTQGLYLGREYLVLLVIAMLASLPVAGMMAKGLERRRSGPAMALYRLGEKVIPPVLLLLSIAYMVGFGF